MNRKRLISKTALVFATLLLSSVAFAGRYESAFSGGQCTESGSYGTATLGYLSDTSNTYGSSNRSETSSLKCEGEVSVTYTWVPEYPNEPQPSSVIVVDTVDLNVQGPANIVGFFDAPGFSAIYDNGGIFPWMPDTFVRSASFRRFSIVNNPGNSFYVRMEPSFDYLSLEPPANQSISGNVTVWSKAVIPALEISSPDLVTNELSCRIGDVIKCSIKLPWEMQGLLSAVATITLSDVDATENAEPFKGFAYQQGPTDLMVPSEYGRKTELTSGHLTVPIHYDGLPTPQGFQAGFSFARKGNVNIWAHFSLLGLGEVRAAKRIKIYEPTLKEYESNTRFAGFSVQDFRNVDKQQDWGLAFLMASGTNRQTQSGYVRAFTLALPGGLKQPGATGQFGVIQLLSSNRSSMTVDGVLNPSTWPSGNVLDGSVPYSSSHWKPVFVGDHSGNRAYWMVDRPGYSDLHTYFNSGKRLELVYDQDFETYIVYRPTPDSPLVPYALHRWQGFGKVIVDGAIVYAEDQGSEVKSVTFSRTSVFPQWEFVKVLKTKIEE